jgi:hypothetical protein
VSLAEARDHHQALISRLMNGPGDSEGAMHRAERMFGLGFWPQWNLRHKRRATAEFIERVHQAYLAMLETSVRRDIEKLKAERAKGSDDVSLETLISESQVLLAKIAAKTAEKKGAGR